jgi:hypothetical protein
MRGLVGAMDDEIFGRYLTDYVDGTVDDPALLAELEAHHKRSERAQRMARDARQINTAIRDALQPLAPSQKFEAVVMEKVRRTSSVISQPFLPGRADPGRPEPGRPDPGSITIDEPTVAVAAVRPDVLGVVWKLWPAVAFLVAGAAAVAALLSTGSPVGQMDGRPEGGKIETFQRGEWKAVARLSVYSGDRLYAPGTAEWVIHLPAGNGGPAASAVMTGGALQVEQREGLIFLYPMQPDRPLSIRAPAGRPLAVRIGKVAVDEIKGTATVVFNSSGALTVTVSGPADSARVSTDGYDSLDMGRNGLKATAEQNGAPKRP